MMLSKERFESVQFIAYLAVDDKHAAPEQIWALPWSNVKFEFMTPLCDVSE